ncbi:CASTOR/POLLUX-related putative ion channel [Butyrivibrio sp. AE2032]|uniref:CASTOR/POLLUX-related putative ion channel n=1 Tax=Butyrivibrio sp. AE2032 TaxID=1458463 RepID=UPI00054FCC04|nr:hypothetical protein [Butyrivibrio sp. AE2032]
MKHSFKERFAYWFDTQMSKGSMGLIKLLAVVSVFAIMLITVLLVAFGYSEADMLGMDVFWDSFATVINAWLPFYEDGAGELGYLIIMSIAAIIGLLITSVLIGIISNAIEEHIDGLKDGKSMVLEKDHVVILGFIPGEYTLIKQVVLAAGDKKRTIVIGSEVSSEEMRDTVSENVDIPKNIKMIYRTIDIFDPTSLEKCSLATSRHILINPMDDKKTIKVLLAVSLLINSTDNEKVRVSALVSKNEHRFPDAIAAKHNVTTIQMRNAIARMIALSCTQTGLSDAFREVFSFDGNEFYSASIEGTAGISFGDLSYRLDKAVPVGVLRDDKVNLNPGKDFMIEEGDKIIVFAEDREAPALTDAKFTEMPRKKYHSSEPDRKVAIIGYNSSFELVYRELASDVAEVVVAGIPAEKKEEVMKIGSRFENRKLTLFKEDIDDAANMTALAKKVNHIVLLSDYSLEEEDADIQSIFRILSLRDIRLKYELDYNITAEMCKKANLNLIREEEHMDYVVASNMSSLFLAQLSENYELNDLFKEILSNRGNELYLKRAKDYGYYGMYTTQQLRNFALANKCIFLGYMKAGSYESFFNPGLMDEVRLGEEDSLIVLAEN